MKKLAWLVVNGLFAAVVVAATYYGMTGAYNVLVFVVVLTGITGVIAVITPEVITDGFTFGVEVETTYDIIITSALVWFGYWALGTVYLIGNFLLYAAKLEREKEKTD